MIGNIISSNELKVDENFNVVDSMDKAIDGLPTLIIGLDNVRKIETDLNFVDRKLSDNTYWTFNKQERREWKEYDVDDRYYLECIRREQMNIVPHLFDTQLNLF